MEVKNLIGIICGFITAAIGLFWGGIARFMNTDLTETELFIKYWYLLIPLGIFGFLYLLLTNRRD